MCTYMLMCFSAYECICVCMYMCFYMLDVCTRMHAYYQPDTNFDCKSHECRDSAHREITLSIHEA